MFDYKSNCLPRLDNVEDQCPVLSQLGGGGASGTVGIKREINTTRAVQQQQHQPAPVFCHSSSLQRISSHKSEDQTRAGKTPAASLPLVPQLSNSALVHQRASAGDQLAAASATTAASLPLMIGGRSKCVVNLVDRKASPTGQPDTSTSINSPSSSSLGPQNTALRAEQRRQNMSVSVVRPVVNTTTATSNLDAANNHSAFSSTTPNSRKPSLQSEPSMTGKTSNNNYSLVDDWMNFEKNFALESGSPNENILDQLLLSNKLGKVMHLNDLSQQQHYSMKQSEQESRQQAILMRREEHELNRHIQRQHHFLVDKFEERKRNLQIIQSVWVQRDFRHAMEKLVDIYHQGLVFAPARNEPRTKSTGNNETQSQLSSMNTSLVVDVVGIIILRPKLWTLEICQLLLPIIINDLLMQTRHEYYVEVALKALRLILTHFSSVIKSTLESLKHSNKLVGVDLSREDRINKCLTCYKHLVEAHSIVAARSGRRETSQCKLEAQYRELQSLFGALQASFELDPLVVLRRLGGSS